MPLITGLLSILMLFQTAIENIAWTFPEPDAPTAIAAEEPEPAMQYIGTFTCYAYCPCEICCGKNANGITATGTTATAGRTIAVDPNVIPLGTTVIINGHEYIAEDTGGGIKGNTLDMFMDSHDAALQWGVKTFEVYVIN